jgi:tRNA(Ile)-lysidine synthase
MSPSPNACRKTAPQHERFEAQVAATIDAYHLLRPKDRVLVAVSGGPDSIALLHALVGLRNRYGITLSLAHLHHGLREAAAMEQAFVADLAERLALPFHTERRDVGAFRQRHGLSLEDAARQVRYAFLEATADAQACTRIALGHQADDTVELLLMNLIRGSGPLGMSGIAPSQGRLIRPLIDIHRNAITAYLKAKNLDTCHDESNDDPAFTRNRIRNELIPHLERTYNPRLRQTLQRTARILRDEERWIEHHLDTAWIGARPSPCPGGIRIKRSALLAAPVALQRRMLRRALAKVAPDLKRFGFTHIEEMRRLAAADDKAPRWLDLPRDLRGLVEAEWVTLLKESAEARRSRRGGLGSPPPSEEGYGTGYRHEIACPDENHATKLSLDEIDARLVLRTAIYQDQSTPETPWEAHFDLDRLSFPLVLRPAKPGDRLQPLGMAGRKKLSDLFIDGKIPRPLRRRLPVLVSGGRIVWAVGVRRDHDTRVRAGTRRLLIGEFCLLK